ncbi:MAG: hypothetical protein H9W81_07785 [Enterococcus sp.]|nr:hypothetical protein [Enterococcus sp.]
MSDNNIFREGDRVEGGERVFRPVFGTVQNPKTPYGRVEVLWDDDTIENTNLREWELKRVTAEEERATDIEEACRLLERHGLNYTISDKVDGELAVSK